MAMESDGFISLGMLVQFMDVVQSGGGCRAEDIPANIDEIPYNMAMERFEIGLLKGLLKKHGGNIEVAAREAGMNMVTIYRKLKKYAIRKEECL